MTLKTRALSGMLGVLLATCVLQVQAAQPADAAPTATSHYLFIPASTFVPRTSSDTYSYQGGGCISAPNLTDLIHKLTLPAGSNLRYVRSYYRDENANAVEILVWGFNAAGGVDLISDFASLNGSGYTSVLSPLIGRTVDQANSGYVVNARFGKEDGTIFVDGFDGAQPPQKLVFCGIRVLYEQ